MLRSKHLVALSLLALATAASLTAAASTNYSNASGGTSCRPRYQSGASGVMFEDRGAGNLSPQPQELFCPANPVMYCPGVPWSMVKINVYYQDNSSTSDFSCYLYETNPDGWQWWGQGKYTCTTYGGCPDETKSFTGRGTLTLVPPATSVVPINYGVACSIAGGNNTWSGSSWIFGQEDFYSCGFP